MQSSEVFAIASAPAAQAFVGRERELQELAAGFDAVQGGRGQLYLLSGEPGIGKTRLCDELSAAAAARGVPVLWGRCWEAGGAPAYWPWLHLLAGLAEMIDDASLARALGDGAAAVGELVPGLRERVGAPPGVLAGSAEEARFRLFRAVGELLRCAALQRGLLIVLDDVHAADEPSLRLLQFLARELRGARVLAVATFRDVEARLTPEIGEALAAVAREGRALPLSRLGQADSERLLNARVGEIDAAVRGQIFQRTQGNPLFLEEMARLLRADGAIELGAGALPIGVRDVIRQRIARVSGTGRALLEVSAISGDEIDPALVAEAAGRPVQEVHGELEAAADAGVLVRRERARFRFSHALVREVLDRDLSDGRRAELHAAIAQVLERRMREGVDPPYEELAHHLLLGPPGALGAAVTYALRAAERSLALFAFEGALALLERAQAAVIDAGGEPRLRADVLIALAQVHIRRGAGGVGQQLCCEAAELARALADAELLAHAALAYGLEITAALVDPVLVAMLQEALAALPPADSPLRVRVMARLAAAMQPARDLQQPIGLAREAIASARRIGAPATLLDALYTGMSAMMDIVDPRERLPLNLEIEQHAAAQGDRERQLRTQARLVFDHMELGDLAGADARIDMFERLAREADARRYAWRVPLFRSMRAMMHGRFAEAEQLCEQARALGTQAGDPQLERCHVFHREGLLRAWERHEDMIAYDPEARRLRAALYSGPHWQNGGSAFTYARTADLDRARMYLDLVPQDDWPLVQNPPAFMHLGEPLALVGQRDLVETLYELLLQASHRCVSWGWTKFIWDGTATRVLGLLAARLERWEDAVMHFEQAIEQLERMDAQPYLARTRYELGRALVQRGRARDLAAARARLEQAYASALALGMSGIVRLAGVELERLRVGTATANPAGAAGARATVAGSRPQAHDLEAAADGALPFTFRCEGETWAISYGVETFRLRDSLGLQYLGRLFAEPGREIHALELSGGKAGAAGEAADLGDAGELLDEDARTSYRRRLAELRETLEEADSLSDLARVERAREEIEFLQAELARAVGLGGKVRRAGGAGERARSAVQRRIRNAIERVREHSPALADLLHRAVRTGTFCVFRPEAASR